MSERRFIANNGAQKNSKGHSNKSKQKTQVFKPYLPHAEVAAGLKRGELIKGQLRINVRNYEDAYIDDPDNPVDIYIYGIPDRNRSLHGDVVVVRLKPKEDWRVTEDSLLTTAEVTTDSSFLDGTVNETEESAESQSDLQCPSVMSMSAHSLSAPIMIPGAGNRTPADLATPPPSFVSPPPSPSGLQLVPDEVAQRLKDLGIYASDNSQAILQSYSAWQHESQNAQHTASPAIISAQDVEKGLRNHVPKDKMGRSPNGSSKPKRFKTFGELSTEEAEKISEDKLQKMAEVVYILERVHTRCGFGTLKALADGNRNFALFSATDGRVPRMLIPTSDCPKDFWERPYDYKNMLYVARISDWPETSNFAFGCIHKCLGEAGEIAAETEGVLMQYDIDSSDFSPDVIECLPTIREGEAWQIPEEEYRSRRDFRQEILFTIDPATARDLDDALHVKQLSDDLYEIGVHIADVSYFVKPGTALDDVAAKRGNTTYLVHQVIPMLPRLLCEELCSLNPGVDRLTFSVVWEMDSNGNVFKVWFGRSVICSCAKLNYDHAQGFLNDPQRGWGDTELPTLFNSASATQISWAVNVLGKMAKAMRKRRFDEGALKLDQAKLSFALDAATGLPIGCTVYEYKDSNRLIEEFMLLANMAVARHIYNRFEKVAVLRRHPPPKEKVLAEVTALCESLGFPIDSSSSKQINDSLSSYLDLAKEDEQVHVIGTVLVSLLMRPMQLAVYFCPGGVKHDTSFRHYALSVPLYTHFTSPIRRYPDIMVHRLLAACLGYIEVPDTCPEQIQRECQLCNTRKYNSKVVSELSAEMFFSIFVKECGPLYEAGVVMGVQDHAFDVLIIKYGLVKRVYCNQLDLLSVDFFKKPLPRLELVWRGGRPQEIKIFTSVNLILTKGPDPLKFLTLLKAP